MSLWQQCLEHLSGEVTQQHFNQYFSPLQAEETGDGVVLFAPNQYVLNSISDPGRFSLIEGTLAKLASKPLKVVITLGRKPGHTEEKVFIATKAANAESDRHDIYASHLNPTYTFKTFVEGNSNELAKAAATQIAENPGAAYNPFFLYGGVGLGKTHLMHAIGNLVMELNPKAKVVYMHSERFVAGMVKALQNNTINDFKNYCRSMDVIIVDDVQFLAGKERSQEEFFHTFNALVDDKKQIILASDRYPKELEGVEERLRSRFGSGLTVAIQPPDLETRVAILMNKAESYQANLDEEVAFFIAKKVRSNVRELEGALKRVIANAKFTGNKIDIPFVKDALKDLLAIQEKMISADNIIKVVSEYYKVKVADLLSKRRSRSVARPRQVAMALCKELTNHSLPEIGAFFGGRDHTTVLHAVRLVRGMVEAGGALREDFYALMRLLTN